MKQFLSIVVFLTGSLLFAQETFTANFDYEVKYEVLKKTKEKDTFKIAFDKTGRYLWTDDSSVSSSGLLSMILKNSYMDDYDLTNIIYDTKTNFIRVHLKKEDFSYFLRTNLKQLLVDRQKKGYYESVSVTTQKSSQEEKIFDEKHLVYKTFVKNENTEPQHIFNLTFDENFSINNNAVLNIFLNLLFIDVLRAQAAINVPKGLLLQIESIDSEKEEVLIKAIEIKKISRTITINNTLEIKE